METNQSCFRLQMFKVDYFHGLSVELERANYPPILGFDVIQQSCAIFSRSLSGNVYLAFNKFDVYREKPKTYIRK